MANKKKDVAVPEPASTNKTPFSVFNRAKQLKETVKNRKSMLDEIDETLGRSKKKKVAVPSK